MASLKLMDMVLIPLVFQTKKNNYFAGVLSGFDNDTNRLFITEVRDIKRSDMDKSWDEIKRLATTAYDRVEVKSTEIKDLHVIQENKKKQQPQKPQNRNRMDNGRPSYYQQRNFQSVQQENNRNPRGFNDKRTSPQSQNNNGNNRYASRNNESFEQRKKRNSDLSNFVTLTSDDMKNDYDFEQKNNEFEIACHGANTADSLSAGSVRNEKTAGSERDDSGVVEKTTSDTNNFFDNISSSTMIENNRQHQRGGNNSQNNSPTMANENGNNGQQRNNNFRRFSNRNRNNGYRNFQRQSKTGVPFQDLLLQTKSVAAAQPF
jgi:hypothetical protein